MGFTLARLQYIDFNGVFCSAASSGTSGAAPGECYHYIGYKKIGIILHLATILPAALLACFQFTPVIRHKLLIFHRINGYTVILLSLLGNAGALMIARTAFGGTLATQSAVGFLAIITTASLALSYYNIKMLQIDQHRAWMLRAWFYFGTIITVRIIMILSALIISASQGFYTTYSCAVVDFMYGHSDNPVLAKYPACAAFYDGSIPDQHVAVLADISSGDGGPEGAAAALGMSFGMAMWLALALHAFGVELYLNLTPREGERLRQVSYERQLEGGFKNPGNAGLTVQRLGDADEWVPKMKSLESDSTFEGIALGVRTKVEETEIA